MKKIDLGQTITVLANLGVIAGIVFLGYELRQNNELMSADANMRLLDNRLRFFELLSTNDEFAIAYLKRSNGEELTPLERYKLQNSDKASWIKWNWEFIRYIDGYVTRDELPASGWRAAVREYPALVDIWTNYRDTIAPSPEFVEFVETEVIGD
jgi:hypothetical protein